MASGIMYQVLLCLLLIILIILNILTLIPIAFSMLFFVTARFSQFDLIIFLLFSVFIVQIDIS